MTELLTSGPAWPCSTDGQPSAVRPGLHRDRCAAPAHMTVSRTWVITLDGERTDTAAGTTRMSWLLPES
jgi:hypothetical protein